MGNFIDFDSMCGDDTANDDILLRKSDQTNTNTSASRLFRDMFSLKSNQLGSGAFSVVYIAIEKGTKQEFAVKVIEKQRLKPHDIAALQDEVGILREISHPHILKFKDFFDEQEYFYLVTEVIRGGELFDRIVDKTTYNEHDARVLIKILLDTIDYLHTRNIVHRDLKPENLLLTSPDDDADVKLADFGFAKHVSGPYELEQVCGTPDYVAPEIISHKKYGTKVDIWSCGIITYILLGGYPPFQAEDDTRQTLFKNIIKGDYEFHQVYWKHVSDEAKDLIRKMLVVDPDKRSTAHDLLRHPWINQDKNQLMLRDLGASLKELKAFNAKRRLRGSVHALSAANYLTKLARNSVATETTTANGSSPTNAASKWFGNRRGSAP